MEIKDLARLWSRELKSRASRHGKTSVRKFEIFKELFPVSSSPILSAFFGIWILVVYLLFCVDVQGVVFYHVIRAPAYALLVYLVLLAFARLRSDALPADNMLCRDQVAHDMRSFLGRYGYGDVRVIKLLHTETLRLLNRTSGKDWVTRYLPVIIASVISPLGSFLVNSVAGLDDLGAVIICMMAFGVFMCLLIYVPDLFLQTILDHCPYTRTEVQRFYDDLTSLLLRLDVGNWEEASEKIEGLDSGRGLVR